MISRKRKKTARRRARARARGWVSWEQIIKRYRLPVRFLVTGGANPVYNNVSKPEIYDESLWQKPEGDGYVLGFDPGVGAAGAAYKYTQGEADYLSKRAAEKQRKDLQRLAEQGK